MQQIVARYEALLNRKNTVDEPWDNGIFERYAYPILTNEHTPYFWRYDLNQQTNPFLMERWG